MTPVLVAVSMVALNFLLNITLIWTPLNTAGLALSTAFCAILQMIILQRLLAHRVGPMITGDVRRSWWHTFFASIFMGGVLSGAMLFTPTNSSWIVTVCVLLGLVGLGGGAFFVCAKILRMPELRWALGKQ
jgi:peptidoglycan biosynthesis protein MviN/MurJ (putative lipid II flippase)